jgi:hypothetical protein
VTSLIRCCNLVWISMKKIDFCIMCVLFDFPFCFSLDLSLSCLCFDLGCSWISSWLFADMSSVPTLFVHHCSVWHARAEWCSVGTTGGIHTAALVRDFLLVSFTSRSNFFSCSAPPSSSIAIQEPGMIRSRKTSLPPVLTLVLCVDFAA